MIRNSAHARTWPAFLVIPVVAIVMAGCAAAAPAAAQLAFRVVMAIGTQVLISEGAEFVEKMIDSEPTVSSVPIVRISHHDANGVRVTTSYRIEQADAISVSALNGEIYLSGNGRVRAVNVAPGSTATIEIVPSSGGANIDVQVGAPGQTGAVPADDVTTHVVAPAPDRGNEPEPPAANPPVANPPVVNPTVVTLPPTTAAPPVVPPPDPTTTPPPPAPEAPVISSMWKFVEGKLIYLAVSYYDVDGDAVGFGFRGVNGSGWAEENHPFTSPSYGRVGPNRIDYPFNHECGTASPAESDVEFWIYDSRGVRSTSRVVHLSC